MPNALIPMLAAFACALCNGTAAVLQKISADKEKNVTSLDARLLWRLFQNVPYVAGVGLDVLGWMLTLYAVHYLPLFLVEAIIAANIVVTALIERIFMHQKISRRSYFAIITILVGLILVAIASSAGRSEPISNVVKWLIIFSPVPLGIAGYMLARHKSYRSTVGLAVLGGLAFGGTSVIGRIFSLSQPLWHTLYNPLIYALLASGILGILFFSTALQRAQATVMNATMTASQTLIPAVVGIAFLGDDARNGLWYLVVLGSSLTLGGVIMLAFSSRITKVQVRT
jgi:drug/metabolite transporter (DMT)-like permease